MDRESKRRVLLSSPLFAALPGEALDDVLDRATERQVRRNQTVFQMGDEGNYMAAVLSGRIRIHANTPDGREVTLNLIDAGEVFGEIALLDGKPRSAEATAIQESTLLMVERRHFLPHLTDGGVALRVIDLLCQRLRETSETLGNFAMLDLPGRLARRLLKLGTEYGGKTPDGQILLDIRLSDTELSRFVGCTRETVNKQIRGWEIDGILDRDGGRITIRKPSVLRRIGGLG